MKKANVILIAALVFLIIILAGCETPKRPEPPSLPIDDSTTPPQICKTDSDCPQPMCPGGKNSCVDGICSASKCLDLPQPECLKDSDCEVGGCSGTICEKKGERTITTCEYRAEYACYKLTECGCDKGKCSWLEKQEFVRCLNEKSKENKDNEAVW